MDTARRFSCDHDGCCIIWHTSLVFPNCSDCTKCVDFEQGWEEACWSSFAHGFGKLFGCLGEVPLIRIAVTKRVFLIDHSPLHINIGIIYSWESSAESSNY